MDEYPSHHKEWKKQIQMSTFCKIPFLWNIGAPPNQSILIEMHTVEVSGGGDEKRSSMKGLSRPIGIFYILIAVWFTQVNEYVETHHSGNQYMYMFTLCKIAFNQKVKNARSWVISPDEKVLL